MVSVSSVRCASSSTSVTLREYIEYIISTYQLANFMCIHAFKA